VPLNHAVRQIVYGECGRGVHTVIVDGAIVVEDRKLKTVDWPALCAEATGIAKFHVRDLEAHGARMAPAVPFIAAAARRVTGYALDFDRFVSASDDRD
jgi:5-methylthioadenosine/S-adenosylhomocysteine deaminase